MPLVQLATIAAGGVLGFLFALIWRAVARRQGEDNFWHSFARVAAALLAGEDEEGFFEQYWTLLKALAAYVGKMAVRVTLAALPVALGLALLIPAAAARLEEGPDRDSLEWTLLIAIGTASLVSMFLLKRRGP